MSKKMRRCANCGIEISESDYNAMMDCHLTVVHLVPDGPDTEHGPVKWCKCNQPFDLNMSGKIIADWQQ